MPANLTGDSERALSLGRTGAANLMAISDCTHPLRVEGRTLDCRASLCLAKP
jgi:hypothetical protein